MVQQQKDRASLLVQALPYIQKFNGKTIVVKYGGNAMVEDALKDAVIKDIILLSLVGINVVLVHGGGPEISQMLAKLNIKTRFIDGLRYTDKDTMDVVQQILCGKINKNLVSLINNAGGRAIGLGGMDGEMIQAVRRSGKDLGLVGDITSIDPRVVNDVISKGYIPVVSGIAQAVDESGIYNVNADTVAAELAVALGAIKLILLTDVRGVLMDASDEDTLISRIKVADIDQLKSNEILSGGMLPKIECCIKALAGGVERTHIIDGRIEHSILIELLSDEGIGTMITA